MSSVVEIHSGPSIVKIDGVSFNVPIQSIEIHGGLPYGPVFVCGAAKAVISTKDADALVAAGATDKR
jgi:hypothetical protein